MIKKIKSNNGFTLIELVIALAMLAFIMTAVSALMGSSVLNFRKDKANISIQNSAQSTYDKLSDIIMQARDVTIYGYLGPDIDFKNVKDESAVAGDYEAYYFVADKATKKKYTDAGISNVKLFNELSSTDKIYVISMTIEVSVQIENISALSVSADENTVEFDIVDAIHGGTVHVKRMSADGAVPVLYDTLDTLKNTIEFNGKNMYYGREYAFQTASNDKIVTQDEAHTFTNVMKTVTTSTGAPITGCVATVDADNGAIGLDLFFYDKNMEYNTEGMVKIRNSKVLEDN